MLFVSKPIPLSTTSNPTISFILLLTPSTTSCGSRIIRTSITPSNSSLFCRSSIAYIELTTASNKGKSGLLFFKSKFFTLPSKSIENLAISILLTQSIYHFFPRNIIPTLFKTSTSSYSNTLFWSKLQTTYYFFHAFPYLQISFPLPPC